MIKFILFLVLYFISESQAQTNKCATMLNLERRMLKDPSLHERIMQSENETNSFLKNNIAIKRAHGQITTIPVVVHVLWNDPIENISTAQINSQIEVLNEDFRLLNSDSLQPTHPFWSITSDSEIEFCLASFDPNGNPTNGITRTFTDSSSFSGNGYEKFTATGGKDNWDPTKYLNIWVCNLDGSGGTLGYATFPVDLSTNPDEDGVVIRYEAFGYLGTAGSGNFPDNDLGRTATHEIAHWLNLRHIWGDNQPNCGDDFVADTKPCNGPNFGCPTFPLHPNNICGTDVNGEMYMNYMDYVDDACMNMFTTGQTTRMKSALFTKRLGLLSSNGCGLNTSLNSISQNNLIDIHPNPNNGAFIIKSDVVLDTGYFTIYDVLGNKIQEFNSIISNQISVDLKSFKSGIYYLKYSNSKGSLYKKFIISQ